MIIRKRTTLTAFGGAALALAVVAAPAQAQSDTDNTGNLQSDPIVVDPVDVENGEPMAADTPGLSTEDAEMATDEMEMDHGDMDHSDMSADDMAVGESAEPMMDGGEAAARLQQEITDDPRFGSYVIDVNDVDGRYVVSGMIDKFEDYSALQQMLGDVEGVDPALIDNEVVQN